MKVTRTTVFQRGSTPVDEARVRFSAFREATGMGIKLWGTALVGSTGPLVSADNPLCGLLPPTRVESHACAQCFECKCDPHARRTPVVERCHAGLIHVFAPVVRDGVQVATLEGGQVFSHRPTEADFESCSRRFSRCPDEDLTKLRAAYFQTPVLNSGRLQAGIELLCIVGESLTVGLLKQVALKEAPRVNRIECARAFIETHLDEPITMRQAARHVKLCPAYFCRLFKRESGQTFVSYLAQTRVQRAQRLLHCTAKPITEIGYAAGFQTVSHFNHLFKRYTGVTPTQYRRAQAPSPLRHRPFTGMLPSRNSAER